MGGREPAWAKKIKIKSRLHTVVKRGLGEAPAVAEGEVRGTAARTKEAVEKEGEEREPLAG